MCLCAIKFGIIFFPRRKIFIQFKRVFVATHSSIHTHTYTQQHETNRFLSFLCFHFTSYFRHQIEATDTEWLNVSFSFILLLFCMTLDLYCVTAKRSAQINVLFVSFSLALSLARATILTIFTLTSVCHLETACVSVAFRIIFFSSRKIFIHSRRVSATNSSMQHTHTHNETTAQVKSFSLSFLHSLSDSRTERRSDRHTTTVLFSSILLLFCGRSFVFRHS